MARTCAARFTPVPDEVDYGAYFPWTHERAVIQGRPFAQTFIDDLPIEATTDRVPAVALGLQTFVNLPVGIGDRVTHVLGLVSSRSTDGWHDTTLTRLRMIAETFLVALARHDAEQALQRSEQSLAAAQRIASIGSYIHDWRSGVLVGSEEAHHIFDVSPGEPISTICVRPCRSARAPRARSSSPVRRTRLGARPDLAVPRDAPIIGSIFGEQLA